MSLLLLFIYLFLAACTACRILVVRPEIKPVPPAVKTRSLNPLDQQGSPYMLMMSLEHKGSSQSYPISWGLKEKLSGIFFSLKKLITAPLQESMEDELGLHGSKYSAQHIEHL